MHTEKSVCVLFFFEHRVLNEKKQKLGYVPERDNIVFSRLMDAGKLLTAKVLNREQKGTFTQVGISIFLIDF
ncbi:MAG: hypothetical protein IIY55_04070 [Blautia sp.]|nr:hypothetical protein [Blautia sp.]